MNELTCAKCCGNCVHSSKPKKPEEHCAYYNVAKTERWCYKTNRYITRETVCDLFEQNNKSGGVPAAKRIFKFNTKLEKLRALCDMTERLGIATLENEKFCYIYTNNRWHYRYNRPTSTLLYSIDCKSSDAEEHLNTIENLIKENNYGKEN